MPPTSTSVFQIYRYQILPVSQHMQLELGSDIRSIEDLVAAKNRLFAEILVSTSEFTYSRAELHHRIVFEDNRYIAIRLGIKRDIQRETREFTTEQMDNWPSILLIFDNNPTRQYLAIEKNYRAFQNTRTVVSIVENSINERLRRYHLAVRFMATFEKNDFWEIVDRYPDRITNVKFQLISPNMANISESLRLDLDALKNSTSTQETDIGLSSDKNSHLNLSPEDEQVDGLVDYASRGGGNISMRVKGITKRIQTKNKVTEISVDEIEITDISADMLNDMLRNLE